MSRPTSAFAASALVAVFALTSCASQTTPAATDDLPAPNVERWVMPLDAYWSPMAVDLPTYASNLLIAECLGEEGIDWPIPWQPTDEASYFPVPSNMSSLGAPLTAELAQEQGYRADFTPGLVLDEERAGASQRLNTIAASTPGFEPLFDACLGEARDQLDDASAVHTVNTIAPWISESTRVAAQSDAVVEAATDWRDCLGDAGYPVALDAPVTPDGGMPDAELMDQLGIPSRWQPGDGGPENPLVQAEIELAVADATCRASSGWTDAFYEAMWDAQLPIIEEHADELVRLRDAGAELLAQSQRIIAEHAPAH